MSKRSKRKQRYLPAHSEIENDSGETFSELNTMKGITFKNYPNHKFQLQIGKAVQKSSDLLLKFAEPILDPEAPLDVYRSMLTFAMMAWNAASESPEIQEKIIEELLDQCECSLGEELALREDYAMLIERKRTQFGQYNRFMTHVEVKPQPNNQLFVQVAASMSPEERDGMYEEGNKEQ